MLYSTCTGSGSTIIVPDIKKEGGHAHLYHNVTIINYVKDKIYRQDSKYIWTKIRPLPLSVQLTGSKGKERYSSQYNSKCSEALKKSSRKQDGRQRNQRRGKIKEEEKCNELAWNFSNA